MISILTNSAAMTALQSLTATQMAMQTTESRISTGLKVGSAADNAAYWSIATTMRSDNSALSTVSDALNLGSSTINVASNGLTSAIDVVNQIKQKLTAGSQQGVDRTALQSDITQLQKQLKSNADAATFSGQNWLSIDSTANGGNTNKSIVSSYQNGAVSTIDVNVANVALFDSSAATSTKQYNVKFTAAGNLATDVGKLFSSPATGDSAGITIDVNGSKQAATATYNGTGYDVSYASNSLVDNTASGPAATTKVKLDGSSSATDTVDYTATGVVGTTNVFNNQKGILSSLGSAGGAAVAQFDASGNLTSNSINIANLTDSTADQAKLANYLKDVNSSITKMTTAASNLGSVQSRVTLQQTFVKNLMDSLTKGISSLVDADMTQESTRLSALQVQQQLGTQAMSIANQSTQGILSLFRGG